MLCYLCCIMILFNLIFFNCISQTFIGATFPLSPKSGADQKLFLCCGELSICWSQCSRIAKPPAQSLKREKYILSVRGLQLPWEIDEFAKKVSFPNFYYFFIGKMVLRIDRYIHFCYILGTKKLRIMCLKSNKHKAITLYGNDNSGSAIQLILSNY